MPIYTTNTSWATARTWATGEALTASLFNTHIRDQLNALKTPAHAWSELNEASNYTTTSTGFTDIDATDMSITVTTGGGSLLVLFTAFVSYNGTAGNYVNFDLLVDGVAFAGDDGIQAIGPGEGNLAIAQIVDGLASGSHTIRLRWRVSSGTATMYVGAGTSRLDVHPAFIVKEIS